MEAWVLVGTVCIVAALVTVVALFSGGEARRPGVPTPDWVLPTPVEVRAGSFPLTWRGYDPAHVDVYLDEVAGAYEALYVAAPPEAIERARERLVLSGAPETAPAPPAAPSPQRAGTDPGDTAAVSGADEEPDDGDGEETPVS